MHKRIALKRILKFALKQFLHFLKFLLLIAIVTVVKNYFNNCNLTSSNMRSLMMVTAPKQVGAFLM